MTLNRHLTGFIVSVGAAVIVECPDASVASSAVCIFAFAFFIPVNNNPVLGVHGITIAVCYHPTTSANGITIAVCYHPTTSANGITIAVCYHPTTSANGITIAV